MEVSLFHMYLCFCASKNVDCGSYTFWLPTAHRPLQISTDFLFELCQFKQLNSSTQTDRQTDKQSTVPLPTQTRVILTHNEYNAMWT